MLVSEHLFIVSRRQPDLYSYLSREFTGEPEVHVILDRRQGDRRRQQAGQTREAGDRRHADRRGDAAVRAELNSLGYAFVRRG